MNKAIITGKPPHKQRETITVAGAVNATVVPNSAAVPGQKNVTLAGAAEALGASTAITGVLITAKRTNTGSIYVGDSGVTSANGYILDRGASVGISVDNLADVYIDADTNGEGVSFLYLTA